MFLRAPFDGDGRALSQGWGALLAIYSLPLVPCGPADRRGAGTRGVSGVRRRGTFFPPSIYLSIYQYNNNDSIINNLLQHPINMCDLSHYLGNLSSYLSNECNEVPGDVLWARLWSVGATSPM